MNLSDTTVTRPVFGTGNGPQLFRASASADGKGQSVALHFYSASADGYKTTDDADYIVGFANTKDWSKGWKRIARLIQSRMDSLEQAVNQGQRHKLNPGDTCKLFGALMRCDQCFQGAQKLILDSTKLESTAKIEF